MAVKLEPAQDTKAHQVADVHVGTCRVEPLVDGEPLAVRDVVEEFVADDGVIEHPPVEERLQVPIFHVDSHRPVPFLCSIRRRCRGDRRERGSRAHFRQISDRTRLRRASVPRRYWNSISEASLSVLTRSMTRMTRCMALGTFISWAHRRATYCHPSCRAAAAGNSAFRSCVVVKYAAAMSSTSTSFDSTIAVSNSTVASSMACWVLSSAIVAPRMPRIFAIVPITMSTWFCYYDLPSP